MFLLYPRDDDENYDPPFKVTHPPPARDQRHEVVTTATSTDSADSADSASASSASQDPPFKITHPPPARDQRHEVVTTATSTDSADSASASSASQDPPFKISHPPPARDQRHDLVEGSTPTTTASASSASSTISASSGGDGGLAPGAIAAIVIVSVFLFAAIGWVIYTFLRARRLGLPTPTWRSFIPNRRTQSNSTAFEPTRPAAGGFMSRIFPSRGGYDGHSARMARLKEDQQVWNSDMRDREDTEYYGASGVQERERQREEEEIRRAYAGDQDTAMYGAHEDRGRSRSREPPAPAGGVQSVRRQEERPRESFESRRSAFTEGL